MKGLRLLILYIYWTVQTIHNFHIHTFYLYKSGEQNKRIINQGLRVVFIFVIDICFAWVEVSYQFILHWYQTNIRITSQIHIFLHENLNKRPWFQNPYKKFAKRFTEMRISHRIPGYLWIKLNIEEENRISELVSTSQNFCTISFQGWVFNI